MQPLPLGVQYRVRDPPPRLTIQQHSQAHHTAHAHQQGVDRLILSVHLKDSQQGQAADQAEQYKDEEDEGRQAARLLPLPVLSWRDSREQISTH